jgi:hypothetical protein
MGAKVLMMKPAVLALALVSWIVPVAAQDPVTTIPDAYKVQFENEWVKVVRVHYAAGVKLPDHTHPAGATAYVYLNDSEGVVFRHSGGSKRAVTRPAVKTGSIRLSAGGEEHHNAENPAATASDFLRIQIKTMTSRNLRQRIPRPAHRPGENAMTVDYTSDALVIQRFVIAPGKSMVAEVVTSPSLWVAIPSGETRWVHEQRDETIANNGTSNLEFLRFVIRGAK